MRSENSGNSRQNIIVAFLVTVGIAVAFFVFYRSNVARIDRQNQNYIADTARNRAASLENMTQEDLDYIESTAVIMENEFRSRGLDPSVLNAANEEDIPEAEMNEVRDILRIYENRLGFDYLRYIDLHGRDYTTKDPVIQANVSERSYFAKAISGEIGMTYILDSKVTSERQIGFYAPVRVGQTAGSLSEGIGNTTEETPGVSGTGEDASEQSGEIVGFVLGFYGEKYINHLLEISIFDYPCDVVLCDREGTVIYNTRGNDLFDNLIKASQDGTLDNDGIDLKDGMNDAFRFRENGRESVGYAAYTGDVSQFYVVTSFPAEEYHTMIRNANFNGAALLAILTALFVSVFTFYVARYIVQRRKLVENASETIETAEKMITALASEYYSVYYVELDKDYGICFQESGNPDDYRVGQQFPYLAGVTAYAQNSVMPEYREEFLDFIKPETIRARLQKERVISYRYLIEEDGKELYVMIRFAGVRHPEDRDDNIVHAVGMSFSNVDSETRKSMEQNRALRDALVNAEEANRAKTAFLSNMSHEIRTPMNAIIGLNNIALADATISESTRKNLEKTGASAQHLLGIINDILDMSRIESGRMIIKKEEFSFAKTLAQVNTIIKGQCREKGLHYACRIAGHICDYYIGDDTKLRQIMINILGNAVKFTPAGGSVTMTIAETARFEGKSTLQFTFTDTGIGMNPEFIPKIFDPFSQEDSSTTNRYGSTGLGMPITKSIVELMNGTIAVESEKGKGTTFIVTVTLQESERCEEADGQDEILHLQKSGEVEGSTGTSDGTSVIDDSDDGDKLAGCRVLLAEDVAVNAEIMMMVLSMRDMAAEHAENGRIAVDKYAAHDPGYYDFILMDMRMPEMDGLDATRAIRAMDREDAKTIPIIALTANAFDEDVQRSMQAGLNAHLSKPVEPDLLFRTMEELKR
ncbi:MAG: response regulator [Eubacterium sp.]|nr:response regulator [Eubacterium sp.]